MSIRRSLLFSALLLTVAPTKSDALTIILDFNDPGQGNSSDIIGNQVSTWDPTGFGHLEADRDIIQTWILGMVKAQYYDIATNNGSPLTAGQQLDIDFVLGTAGTAPGNGDGTSYALQLGAYVAGDTGNYGQARGDAIVDSTGSGPNNGASNGSTVGTIFTSVIDNIIADVGSTPGTWSDTFNMLAGTTSHELGHALSLSHITDGTATTPNGLKDIMSSGATGLPTADRLDFREFSISGQDGEDGNANRNHIQQLITALGTRAVTTTSGVQMWQGTAGGAGTWNAGNTNWTNMANAGNAPWAGQLGIFGGAGSLINVVGTQNFVSLLFNSSYNLTGGQLAFNGDGSIITETGINTLIDSVITGNGSFTKTGGGILQLGGNNNYTGPTFVNDGTLLVNGNQSGATGLTTVRADGTLGGSGTLGGDVVVENDGTLAPTGALAMQSLTLNSTSNVRFDFTTPNAPGIVGNDVVNVNGNLVLDGVLTTAGTSMAGLYRMFNYTGSLTNNGLTSANVNHYIQYSVPSQINLINTAGLTLNYWDGNTPVPNYNNGVIDGGSGTWILNPPNDNWTEVNGTVNVPYNNGQFAIFAGNAGTVTVSNANGNVTIAGMQFAVDGYTITGDALGTTQAITEIRVGDGTAAGMNMTATVASVIGGNTTLNKTDQGTLILTAANTYTNGTLLNGGTLYANNNNALGAGSVTIAGFTRFGSQVNTTLANNLIVNDSFELVGLDTLTLNGNVTVNNDSIISLISLAPGDDTEVYFNGVISGAGGVVYNYTGANAVFHLTNTNTYSGDTAVVGNAAVVLNSNTGNAIPTDLYIDSTATVTLAQAGQIADTASIFVNSPGRTLNGLAVAGFNLNGFDETLLGLSGDANGRVQLNDGAIDGTGATTAATLTVGEGVFLGIISDGGQGGSLVKNTTGVLGLGGANTYTGGTTINAGTLQTGNLSALGTGPVALNDAILEPISELNISQLDWNDGNVKLLLGPTLLNIAGNFTNGGAGGEFQLAWDNITPLVQDYVLLTYGGTTNFTEPDFSGDPGFNIPNVAIQHTFVLTPNSVNLHLEAQAWGPLLQNSAPVFIPTFADFFVQQAVTTGTPTESNIIRSLHFDPGTSLQVFNNLEVTRGDFTVSGGKAVIRGGTITVPGNFNKYGAGTLDARTDVFVAGNSNIHSGALAVNGRFQTELMNVLPGGTLMGNGIVIGNVLNAGTVAPGNSIGLLTIAGNYTQTRSGTLQIEAASPTNHDILVVTGTAQLDGTLEVIEYSNRRFKYGDQFPFLRAGNIVGKFDEISVTDPDVNRGRFFTAGNTGIVVIAPTSYTLVAETQNQRNVAGALDKWIGIEDGDIGIATLALDLLTEDQYPQAFEAIMPKFYEGALSTGIELSHSQGQMLHQQLSARRLGARANRAQLSQRVESSGDLGKNPKSVKAVKTIQDIQAPQVQPLPEDYRVSTWFQGSGLFSSGGLSLNGGEDFESGTFLAGADYAVTDTFTLGLFAGYGEGWGDYDNGGQIDLERILFGGYATIDVGNFYLNAAIGGGSVEYDIKRPIQFATLDRTAKSDPDGMEFFALLGGGYDFRKGNWTFGPQASLQYSKVALDSFTERGADSLNLRLHDPDMESLRSYLGARVAYTIQATDRVAIIPEVRAFWQHEFMDGNSFRSSLDGGAGPDFDYDPERDEKDSLMLGAGIGLQVGARFYANLYYNVNVGREEPSHNVSISATVKF